MEEDKIEIEIEKAETIKLERILLVNEYQSRTTGNPTFSKILGICHQIEDSIKKNALAEELTKEIASDKKSFPKLGSRDETIASDIVVSIGGKSYYALEIMLGRLEYIWEPKCKYDEKETEKKAQEEAKRLMKKALKKFDKRKEEVILAFDKIFHH